MPDAEQFSEESVSEILEEVRVALSKRSQSRSLTAEGILHPKNVLLYSFCDVVVFFLNVCPVLLVILLGSSRFASCLMQDFAVGCDLVFSIYYI